MLWSCKQHAKKTSHAGTGLRWEITNQETQSHTADSAREDTERLLSRVRTSSGVISTYVSQDSSGTHAQEDLRAGVRSTLMHARAMARSTGTARNSTKDEGGINERWGRRESPLSLGKVLSPLTTDLQPDAHLKSVCRFHNMLSKMCCDAHTCPHQDSLYPTCMADHTGNARISLTCPVWPNLAEFV